MNQNGETKKTALDYIGSATYSPEDNKIRISAFSRLPRELYERVRAAGFIWAPKQEIFIAPMWTPEREDLAIELCGEIGDEDKTLVERAEERAERFGDYSEARASDAESARKAVSAIADNIPLGQPILVGHHSERHARKDAERIENGMRRAVKMWETSQYWKDRAAGAIRAAKYKELPDVRARRIKGIEADQRKIQRLKEDHEMALRFWLGKMTVKNRETGEIKAVEICEENRGLIVDLLGGALGNACGISLCPKDGDKHNTPTAYSCLGNHYPSLYVPRTVEEVKSAALRVFPRAISRCDRWLEHYANRLEYDRAMLAEGGGTVADRKGPEKGGACRCWASPRGGWSFIRKVNRVSVTVEDNWCNGGRNFTRTIPFDKLAAIMTAAEVGAARTEGRIVETADKTGFFLKVDTPSATPATLRENLAERAHEDAIKREPVESGADFDAMRETLRAGIKVVITPQLFPTPPDVAERVVEYANIESGMTILEPSAGSGNILRALADLIENDDLSTVTAVEINGDLTRNLRLGFPKCRTICADFLQCNGDLGTFDRIVMNPPFARGADIDHILHARRFLKPGGKLVAICANGPKQNERLKPISSDWEELPDGTFSEQGTNVRTVLLTIYSQ